MSTEKKAQHYVPKGYLKRFRDRKHKFHVWNLTSGVCEHTDNVTETFSHPYFYDHPRFEELVGHKQAVENWLSGVESNTLRSLGKFLDAIRLPLGDPEPKDWQAVLVFVALQLQRTPGHRMLHHAILQQSADAVARVLLQKNGFGDDVPSPVIEVDETLAHLQDLVNAEKRMELVQRLREHHVAVYVNETAKPFITSDNPVSAVPDEEHGRAVFAGGTARFFMPLSPDVCLGFLGADVAPEAPWVGRVTVRKPDLIATVNQVVALNSVDEILCISGEFYGVRDAPEAWRSTVRGVEVLTRNVPSRDPMRTFLFNEVVFRALRHKAMLAELPLDATVEVGEH